MTFTNEIKTELCTVSKKNCCNLAELYALIAMSGNLTLSNREITLRFETELEYVASRIFSMIKKTLDYLPAMDKMQNHIRQNYTYRIALDGQNTAKLLSKCFNYSSSLLFSRLPAKDILKNKCCKTAFLRGAFLGGGSIADPKKMYHMGFVCANEEFAHILLEQLNYFNFNAKITLRQNNYVIYIKEFERISEFLSITSAHSSLLSLLNIKMVREIRNQVNRQSNCDEANGLKTLNAAFEQIENIKYIDSVIGLESLKPQLREAAYLRLDYPFDTLAALCAQCPPLTKSGLNHRFRALRQIANELKTRE